MELVPWVCSPKLVSFDPVKVAEHRGWKEALAQIEQVILDTSLQFKIAARKQDLQALDGEAVDGE